MTQAMSHLHEEHNSNDELCIAVWYTNAWDPFITLIMLERAWIILRIVESRHDIESLSVSSALCEEIHRWPMDSPHTVLIMPCFVFFVVCLNRLLKPPFIDYDTYIYIHLILRIYLKYIYVLSVYVYVRTVYIIYTLALY